MLKNKLKQLVSIVLTLLQIFTAFSCNAANIALQNSNKVQESAVQATKTLVKEKSNESEAQSKEPKINESVDPKKHKITPKDGEPTIVAQGTCGATAGDDVNWVLYSDSKLVISGTGKMANYIDSNTPWYNYINSITSVKIQDGVTGVGACGFCECSKLTSVEIPNSAIYIGAFAFKNCSSLTTATIGNSVVSIGDESFKGCSELTSIKIPDSVNYIYGYAFQDCSSLATVTIGNAVTRIEYKAFCGCSALTTVTIPRSVTFFGDEAFKGCSALTTVTIDGGGFTNIGYYTFRDCSSLTSVRFNGTKDLDPSNEHEIFDGCTALNKVNVSGEYKSDTFCRKNVIKDYYKITYVLNGGTLADKSPKKYYVNADTPLIAPTKSGYDFAGWTGSNGVDPQTEVTIKAGSIGEKSYIANWKLITYKITYDLQGGKLDSEKSNPDTYTVESDTITLNNPTRSGYDFTGWTGTDLDSKTKNVTISKGSVGHRKYVAKWDLTTGSIAGISVGSIVGGLATIAILIVATLACKHFNIGPFHKNEPPQVEMNNG